MQAYLDQIAKDVKKAPAAPLEEAAFSRQHYQKIAELIAKYVDEPANQEALTVEFIKLFKADNPRFDEARFRAAVKK